MTREWISESLELHRPRAGVLREHLARFAAAVAQRGYGPFTARQHIRVAAEVGRWLARKRVPLEQLDDERAARFLAGVRLLGEGAVKRRRASVHVLLVVLRGLGVVPAAIVADASGDGAPMAAITEEFRRHLDRERGLTPSVCAGYARIAARLLEQRFGHGVVALDLLRPGDVTRFVTGEAHARPGQMKVILSALRGFLRWLHQFGSTPTSLAGCVPSAPDWRLVSVPKALPSAQVEQLLASCDRTTALGRRDYAVLLLLARLGLRAGEIVAMELDDLDWQKGDLVVRGKGGRQDCLPLPRDVGTALADYLRRGRPNCATRRVFVGARAPLGALVGASAISCLVRRALKRAGLEPPRKGAHTLRHALACTMLRRGASLTEIGQILRHRSPDTTALYAKVDISGLRALAPAWPQRAGEP